MIIKMLNKIITVNDELINEYKKIWGRNIDERDIIIYLDSKYHTDDIEEIIKKLSNEELSALIERCIKAEI